MSNIIEIRNLSKAYGNFPVFFDLNISIKEHSSTAILGPNGCGKTTLLKSITGATKVNSGNVSIFNNIIINNGKVNKKILTNVRKKIGFIPDKNVFFDHLTAHEYLRLIDVLAGSNDNQDNENYIETILKELRLDRWSNRVIHTFSTGTKQKLALAAALIHQPELLIMDEPFRGIDPEAHFKLLKFLNEYRSTGLTLFGINKPGTIVICSHQLEDIEKLCDNLIVMNEYGEIVLSGEMNEVKERLLGEKSFEELLFQILHEEEEELEKPLDELSDF